MASTRSSQECWAKFGGGSVASTPFQDSNAFFDFVGADVSQDSQFLFASTNLDPPAMSVVDTESELSAVLSNLPGATGGDGLSVELAQITTLPGYRGGRFCYHLAVDLRDPSRHRCKLEPSQLASCRRLQASAWPQRRW